MKLLTTGMVAISQTRPDRGGMIGKNWKIIKEHVAKD